MRAFQGKFPGVSVGKTQHVPGKGDDGSLHPQADAQVGHLVGPGIPGGQDFPLHPPAAEPPRDENAVCPCQGLFRGGLVGQVLGLQPADLYGYAVVIASVGQSLCYREVGIVEADILAHQGHGDRPPPGTDAGQHGFPLPHI